MQVLYLPYLELIGVSPMLTFVGWVSHWYQHVFDRRKMLIIPPTGVRSNETLVSGYCSLTGIERALTYEGR
jgi:hypothetical protein